MTPGIPNILPPKLVPYAKALYPFIATLITIAITWAVSGTFDQVELTQTAIGLGTTLLSFLVPNGAQVTYLAGEPEDSPEVTTLGTNISEWVRKLEEGENAEETFQDVEDVHEGDDLSEIAVDGKGLVGQMDDGHESVRTLKFEGDEDEVVV